MKLENYLKWFNLEDVLNIEKNEAQFLALQKSWNKINNTDQKTKFIQAVLQNALISYQLSWTWEDWWGEFWVWISKKINIAKLENWKKFLYNSKNNKRLLEIKIKRLDKSKTILDLLSNEESIYDYYQNMYDLNKDIAKIMNQKEDAKTVVFATKMFAYACRIAFNKIIIYPYEISIPIDSRIEKIYYRHKQDKASKKQIKCFFDQLSRESKIPPLHLDSLLWVDYWYKFIKNSWK